MHQKGTGIQYLLTHTTDTLIYILLRIIHIACKCFRSILVGSITRLHNPFHLPTSGKPGSSLPPHVAISCPQLSPLSVRHSGKAHSREDAIIAIVRRLLLAGVRHVSIHDPVQQILVGRFCDRLCKYSMQTNLECCIDSPCYDRAYPLQICVSHVTSDRTTRAELTLDPLMRNECISGGFFGQLAHDHWGPRRPGAMSCATREAGDAANDGTDVSWDGQVTTARYNGPAEAQLTLIEERVGHAGVVSAARRLADRRKDASCSMTVEETVQALDEDCRASVLPSEPDVLIVFPAVAAPSVPVLHGFPFWQLRLTQIIFASQAPHESSVSTILDMIAASASSPKRFGR